MSNPALASIERQMERDAMFTHSALGRNSIRICEVESFAYGLIDVLLSKGVVSEEEVSTAASRVRSEVDEKGDAIGPAVAMRLEPEEAIPLVTVNCAERMPICHSICCKLDFPLSASEIESGKVRWDLGRPYHIRHGEDGHCVHRKQESGFCGVYEHRPGICRTYSCAHDKRIWKDFEGMELNHEWLDANLSGDNRPHLIGVMLYQIQPMDAPATRA